MKHHNIRQKVVGKALIRLLVAVVVIAILLVLGAVAGNVFFDVVREAMATGQDNNFDRTFTNKAPLNAKTTLKLFEDIKELSLRQEETLFDVKDQMEEALIEVLEILIESTDQELSQALSDVLQEVKAGDFEAVEEVFPQLADDLAQIPLELQVAVIKSLLPRMGTACKDLTKHGVVSLELLDELNQRLNQHEAEELGITGNMLTVNQEAREIIEMRNLASMQSIEGMAYGIELGNSQLEALGENTIDSKGCKGVQAPDDDDDDDD